MQRIKVFSALVLGLAFVVGDAAVYAQQDDAPSDRSGDREGGRRGGRGGFGRGGFGGGFGGFGARGMTGGGMGLLGLLRIDAVREELKLGEDQRELVEALSDELNENRPAFPENFRDMTEEERGAFTKQMQEWSAKQGKEAKATLSTILKPEQYTRLTQISIQTQGTAVLADEEVAVKLNLSEEQKTKIAAAIEENQKAMRESFQGGRGGFGGGNFAEVREKMETLRKEGDARVMATLNDEQKKAFEELKGAPFEMPQPRVGGGRGFRGGNRSNQPTPGNE